jgi:SEC-C motif/HEAT repeats
MNETTDAEEGTGAPSLDVLLNRITLSPYGMPVRMMEAVLERGRGVTAALAEALDRWRDDEDHDALWLVVLLGEIGGPDAVAPLIRQLHRTDLEILAEAAVEGLAKIGAPAVPALRELARTGEPAQRLYAYAGLSWIADDIAYAALVEGLTRDRELADVLATALAHHARPETVPALFAVYQECEPWQRPYLEDAMRASHHRRAPERLLSRDWRLRYRRQPNLDDRIDLEWPGIAVLLRQVEDERADLVEGPLRPLDEILAAEPPDIDAEPELCDECSGVVERPMGVPMCPDTAVAVALDQLTVLTVGRDDGIEDLFELLDEMEEDERELREQDEPRRPRLREEREEALADFAEARATCEWLIERGIEEVSAGESVIEAEMARLAARHGDPDRLLAPVPPVRAAVKVGRNDPCPCGSGRKYKHCCLDSV